MLPDAAAPLFPFESNVPVTRAKKQPVALFARQFLPGLLQVDTQRVGYALINVFSPTAHAAHAANEWKGAVEET